MADRPWSKGLGLARLLAAPILPVLALAIAIIVAAYDTGSLIAAVKHVRPGPMAAAIFASFDDVRYRRLAWFLLGLVAAVPQPGLFRKPGDAPVAAEASAQPGRRGKRPAKRLKRCQAPF